MIVLLLVLVVATSFLYNYFNTSQVNRLKGELSLVTDTVNDVGIEYFENFNSTVFRFTVIDESGVVLYDTEVDTASMENHSDREEVKEALRDGKGSSARNSLTLTQKTFYEAVKLESGDVLRISVKQLTVGALILSMLPAICAIILVVMIVALVLSHAMAKKITEPLMQLDLDHPKENDAYEELTPILKKLHKQHKQIKSQIETLKRKSDEFEHIISSMNEGLILLDEHGMILSMNASARRIFGLKNDMSGSDLLLLDRSSKMNSAIWDVLDGQHKEFTEQRNGSEFQFNISPIKTDGKTLGALILIFDITDKAFAERNRQEFTANVSHELKTPLQSIIGSAELLETGLVKAEDMDRFVGNIKNEATRLVSLINDIIRLSQLDENHEPATETVDLLSVAAEVRDVLFPSADKKSVTLNVQGENVSIFGVRRYVYEIIYNLCDNAIRYNVEGGSVTVTIGKEEGHTTLTVSDTGIGIPPEHLGRIFERFYRVDKSHSKETGGTGLGLSIMKHAVQFHRGKVTIDSEVGVGTSVKVIF